MDSEIQIILNSNQNTIQIRELMVIEKYFPFSKISFFFSNYERQFMFLDWFLFQELLLQLLENKPRLLKLLLCVEIVIVWKNLIVKKVLEEQIFLKYAMLQQMGSFSFFLF